MATTKTDGTTTRNVVNVASAGNIPPVNPEPAVVPPVAKKKTLTGFAKVWVIFWLVANLAAAMAPANRLTDSRFAGLYFIVMVLSAGVALGYFLLYKKNQIGLLLILVANVLGLFMNNIKIPSYSVTVTTGLIIGFITYFITRKQIAYGFGKPPATK